MTPQALARRQIDSLLQLSGWQVCHIDQVNLHAALGVAIREFPLNTGHCFAEDLLCANDKACPSWSRSRCRARPTTRFGLRKSRPEKTFTRAWSPTNLSVEKGAAHGFSLVLKARYHAAEIRNSIVGESNF
jgi:hypothetical protein